MARIKWTTAMLAQLREHYPTMHTPTLAAQMGITPGKVHNQAWRFGLKKSAEFMATSKSGRLLPGGKFGQVTQFSKGDIPWNKGRQGWQAGGRSELTRFSTGISPPNTMPVGSLRIVNNKGVRQLERKISNAQGPATKRWHSVHRLVWEAAHGPVPKGSIVVFRRGMKTLIESEITLEKIDCITRAEHAQRNHIRNVHPELGKLCQLKGAITRQVNRIKKEHEERQAA